LSNRKGKLRIGNKQFTNYLNIYLKNERNIAKLQVKQGIPISGNKQTVFNSVFRLETIPYTVKIGDLNLF